MSEQTIVTAEAPAPKAKKSRKAKPRKAARASANGSLLRPQVRILRALSKAPALSKAQLVQRSGVHANWVVEYLGSPDPVSVMVRGAKKLIPAKLADRVQTADGDVLYRITAPGRKALAAAEKE